MTDTRITWQRTGSRTHRVEIERGDWEAVRRYCDAIRNTPVGAQEGAANVQLDDPRYAALLAGAVNVPRWP